MKNIINYIKKHGENSFYKLNFNELDALIFAQLVYSNLNLSNDSLPFKIKDLKNQNIDKMVRNNMLNHNDKTSIELLINSSRYKNLKILDIAKYNNEQIKEQFYAISVEIADQILITFRGTDTTFNGWIESLSMSFDEEIPSQVRAKEYVTKIAQNYSNKIILCGHSKGGNLAVFAGSTQDSFIQKRIIKIYDFDGPGFLPEFYNRHDYSDISDKICKFIPGSSIFGMMLESVGKIQVIESSSFFANQHFIYYWHINGTKLKTIKEVNSFSKHTNTAINKWMKEFSENERNLIINQLFNLIEECGYKNMQEMNENRLKSIISLKRKIDENSEEYTLLSQGLNYFVTLMEDEIKKTIWDKLLFWKR